MARKRMLDPNIWTDERLARCTHTQRLLYIGCKSNADDEGRLKANPHYLKATIFPYDSLPVSIVVQGVLRLATEQLIIHYTDKSGTPEKRDYIQMPDWHIDQYIRQPRPSTLPPPEGYTPTSTPMTPNRMEKKGKEGKKILCPDCKGKGEVGSSGYERTCFTCKGKRLIWREDYELLKKAAKK